ncbi:MAG: hypothetical protein II984_06665, partial [Clostridia bacterium]|nr:hypothetical protein [Clostridia bacterium]
DKDLASLIKREYRDEKAVKNALREMKEGEYEVFLPGEEGYEDANVIIENYVPTEKIDYIPKPVKSIMESDEDDDDEIVLEDDEDFDDFDDEIDSAELMGADEVFNNESGYSIEDGEE